MSPPLTKLEKKIAAAFSVGQERAREFIFSCHAKVVFYKITVIDMLAILYVWGLRDMVGVVMEHERKKKMRSRDYDLTDEQYTIVHETLPKIADLALAYLVSGLPKDSYFDGWAGALIAAGDTASWGDDALGCALIDVGEKYEKLVLAHAARDSETLGHVHGGAAMTAITTLSAEVRGALLRAGSLLISVNNKLIPEKEVAQTIVVAVEKYMTAHAKFRELGIPLI